MATTTDSPGAVRAVATAQHPEDIRPGVGAVDTGLATLVLMTIVFIGGATVMTVEMSASRLLAPYFGTSLFIWAILIGMVMIYLTLGYWLGGRLADRFPRAGVLYGMTGIAGFAVGLIPVLSGPILRWSLQGFANLSLSIFLASLVGTILLFSVPLILLGFVSPFAIRLRAHAVTSTGGTAGGVSALSTLGSILGTFIPAFILIPKVGTATTLYIASGALLLFSILGLASTGMAKRALVFGGLLVVVLAIALFGPRGFIKPPNANEKILYETESAYNYIRVTQVGKQINLALEDGHAIHSIYNPDSILTGGPWDYWLVAPYFTGDFKPSDMKSMAMIGSAAGTAAREMTAAYGPIPIDGVEIDQEIVDVGNRYFGLGELKNVVTHVEDGRTYLSTDGKDKKWTVVGIDAYRQPYIPFHLTTTEFFSEVKDHLTDDGAVMINAGRVPGDTRLPDALANTMLRVYPNVYVIDVPTLYNSMIIGTKEPTAINNFAANAAKVDNPILKQVFQAAIEKGNIREARLQPNGVYFTDDKAPVEEVVDQIILGVVGDSAK